MEGGWSVEFHSCVDLCMMRGVVGCIHGGLGRWLSRLLQVVKGKCKGEGSVHTRNVGGGIEVIGCGMTGKGFT